MCFGPTVPTSPGGPSSADAAGGRVGPPRTNWTQLLGEFGAELGCPGPPGTSTAAPSRRRNTTPYFMSWWQQLAWTAIFAVMVFVAVGGNSIVMWIVLAHRRMRTVTNYFLVNLSVADLLMAIFNCIFNFVYMLNSDWQFGRSYCTINNFVANVTVAASVFTLTGISIDRYLAIVRPLQPRMSKLSARITIVVIWVASAILGSPCLLYSTTITYKSSGQIRTACILVWPDGQPMVSTLDYVYNVVLFIVTYVLPMSAMAGCYTAMGRELWGSRSIGELTQRQIDSIRSKRKVVRMFIIIVLIFAVCWLPYHAYFIYTHHHSSVAYTKYVQHLYLAFYWLAMANCMVNPLIYYWMNARFRQYFKHAVCEWNCTWRRKQTPMDGAETPPMLGRYSHSYSRSRSADECSAHRNGGARNGNNGVASGGSAGGIAAGSGTGNNGPGSNVSRQVCACIELHAPSNRVMTTLRNVDANRSINDLSGSGSSPKAGTASGNRRSHHHHHNHHRFHKRCRHNCSSNTTSTKRSNDTTATKTGTTGASNKANNNGTVVNVTKEANYLQWRRNQYLFTFNEETNNGNNISSTSRNIVHAGKKETMATSVDL